MPRLRPASPRARSPHVVVLGDLVLDVVLAPARRLETGTDVPGRVVLCQGGSAANTARWLGRLGVATTLVTAVGRDGVGRTLVEAVRSDGVVVRASRVVGRATGRVGVLVTPDGERSFVADRGAADALTAADLRPAWFVGIELLHLPVYSLLGDSLGAAGREAVRLARAGGARVSLDLASVGPLLAGGRTAALDLVRSVAPDVLFATATELQALLGSSGRLAERAAAADSGLAPIVVVKRGSEGATVACRVDSVAETLRFDVATEPIAATDTTGAGDAFDAGFIAGWLAALAAGRSLTLGLRQAAVAGHRVAARQLAARRPELPLR